MRLFIGYGYNARDAWIEKTVFPIVQAMNIDTVDGKKLHGEVLQAGVKRLIEQSDALVGFCTLRKGQESAEFNTHPWVRDEMVYAIGLNRPVLEVREKGVKNPPGLVGDRQRISLNQQDRLSCVTELVQVISVWSMRRLLLAPTDKELARKIHRAIVNQQLKVCYRTRVKGVDSPPREGRIDRVNGGLYLNALGLPSESLVEIEGKTQADGVLFNSGWASADLVRIEF